MLFQGQLDYLGENWAVSHGSHSTADATLFNAFFAVPSAAPENVSAEAVSSTQILLTWASVPEQDQNGLILGYKVGAEAALLR